MTRDDLLCGLMFFASLAVLMFLFYFIAARGTL